MNLKKIIPSTLIIFLMGMALLVISCQRNAITRAMNISNSIQDVDEEMRRLASLVDVTATSLETLINAEAPNLKNDFDTYTSNLNNLKHQGKIVNKRSDEMKVNSKEYFSEWEKKENTYTNQTIRDLSEQRRTKLANSYDEVRIKSIEIKVAYLAYETNLNEIQSYLANDLTPGGIKALKPVTQKANQDLKALKKSFVPVIDALNDIRSQLYGGTK